MPLHRFVSIPLTELPLRPSTLQRLTHRGFETIQDVEESKKGGMGNLAAELDVSLQEAAGLWQELLSQCAKRNSTLGMESTNGSEGASDNASVVSPASRDDDSYYDYHGRKKIVTAYDLLLKEKDKNGRHRHRYIVTFSKSLDHLLGGGVALGQVTELAGMPGTGKTQLATQLCVLARLPQNFGGVEGQALYVDAEGSFLPERAWTMAKALQAHVHGTALRRIKQKHSKSSRHFGLEDRAMEQAQKVTAQEILNSIRVFRVHDETALLATLYSLKEYVEQQLQTQGDNTETTQLPVRLIVIDSIAFHFRAVTPTDSSYYIQRTKTLASLAAFLGELANKYDIAIVAINQMTTKLINNTFNQNENRNGAYGGVSMVVPALGETWAHATATRLLLSVQKTPVTWKTGEEDHDDDDCDGSDDHEKGEQIGQFRLERTLTLVKSSNRPFGTAKFQISEDGIRDVGGSASSGNKRRRTQ